MHLYLKNKVSEHLNQLDLSTSFRCTAANEGGNKGTNKYFQVLIYEDSKEPYGARFDFVYRGEYGDFTIDGFSFYEKSNDFPLNEEFTNKMNEFYSDMLKIQDSILKLDFN